VTHDPHESRIVVIGAGLAGLRVVENLRAHKHRGPITLVGEERRPPYDRPPLSKEVLRGERPVIELRKPEAYDELGLDLRLGVSATGLDVAAHEVQLDGGVRLPYDHVVIATGAVPRRLPTINDVAGVHYLRTAEDSLALGDAIRSASSFAVVGGGFIGCEVAASARAMDVDVTLIELLEAPLARVLGPVLGEEIAQIHSSHGVDVRCGVGVSGAVGESAVERLLLSDGSEIDADIALVCLGVVPATDWLAGSDLHVDNGVVCDQHGRASAAGVWAVGDMARWRDPATNRHARIEHWTNAVEQAEVAAANILAGTGDTGENVPLRSHAPVPYVWSDQYDFKIQSVGYPEPDDDVELLRVGKRDRLLALYHREGTLTAAVGFSAAAAVMKVRTLLASGVTLDEARAAVVG
jgi:3-phenylpropionate/trans-cinnamate dioxygenase ferredoxin reductase subunit